MDNIIQEAKQAMIKVLEVLRQDIATVRTGRAAPSFVENIIISVYGGTAKMRLMELSTITTSDAQTIVITPFDNSIIGEIQKGIQDANMGLNAGSDGQVIRISVPPLSQERRQQLIKLMHQKLENGRIMVRQVRHDAMDAVKKERDGISEDEVDRVEKEVQKVTNDFISEIDIIGKNKEKDLIQI